MKDIVFQHEFFMNQALQLATLGLYSTHPNPRVGCVVVQANKIISQGWHQHAGGLHAEIHALQQAGEKARGADLYVTLEPCSHFGKTPPCIHQIISSGIKRVIAGSIDPNPQVSGKGFAALKAAGIEVIHPILEKQCRDLNPGFFSKHIRQQPWIRVKIAASLDGKIALANGESQWITGPEAREDGHRWRLRSSAVIIGIGSVLKDNPTLTARCIEADSAQRQPIRIVLDSGLRFPNECNLRSTASPEQPVWIITNKKQVPKDSAGLRWISLSLFQNTNLASINYSESTKSGIDLKALFTFLLQQDLHEILIEAGAQLTTSCLKECADEIILYQAPKLLGTKARSFFSEDIIVLARAPTWHISAVDIVGNDLRVILQR
ncbi:MAG: bifunctional diaminohydroxyphosphoribosylaminopyrimidine deaminase/5-amino-6-(5-phosphoribosylamino)uracil reductase RibD [Pseudomonadota bacterium]